MGMSVRNVAFAMYPVTDIHRAVHFYEDDLGLKKEGLESAYWVEFDVDGTTFGIGNFEQVGKPGTAQSLAIEIADLDAYRARLTERGIVSEEPEVLQNCRISSVRDPDGNMVMLHEKKPNR